ncbi:peroxiredoxin [Fundidesulfovibrio soli]|uniref:peroxiredoxin n=1 Tax=Fundidesulfovibrio soli TaxID=2922716 RepID=UPI001FB01C47|nr:peroxiredoxin [Fundidesulfovibrio soli]
MSSLETSAPAPKIELDALLPTRDEKRLSLADMAGKWVVAYIYPKDSTPGCTVEAQEFTALAGEFEKLGAVVWGISRDSIKAHRNFMGKNGLGVALLSDPSLETIKALGGWGTKKVCGKECEGVIRSTVLVGPDGTVARRWPKASSKGHAQEVLDALRELAGK